MMSYKSAYLTSEVFTTILKDHFIPRKPSGNVFIVLVGHSLHVSDIGILDIAN
jgi:hypothetical protein